MIGSSETTREPPLSSFDFSDFVEHHLVQHKTHADQGFLEWLVGFAEGDGTFCSREISLQQPTPSNRETNASTGVGAPAEILLQSTQKLLKRRLLFHLVQKDPKVLHRIRAELGFGAVRQSGNGAATHWRYTVEDRRGLQRIMAILNGNLVLPKRRLQFAEWVNDARGLLWPSFVLKDTGPVASLETGWLAGFIDAEGCFYAHFTSRSQRSSLSYRLTQKVHITQQDRCGEAEVLRQVGELLESSARVSLVKPPDCFRIEVSSLHSHGILVRYLKRFPVIVKAVVFRQWWRVYLLRVERRHLNETGILRMRRLCLAMRMKQKEMEAPAGAEGPAPAEAG